MLSKTSSQSIHLQNYIKQQLTRCYTEYKTRGVNQQKNIYLHIHKGSRRLRHLVIDIFIKMYCNTHFKITKYESILKT